MHMVESFRRKASETWGRGGGRVGVAGIALLSFKY